MFKHNLFTHRLTSAKLQLIIIPLFFCSCISYKLSNKTENEKLVLTVIENKALYDQLVIPSQEIKTRTRGLVVVDIISQAISLGTNLVKVAIDKEKSKYTRDYQFAQGHNYFYSELSTQGPMDPKGFQFEGVEIIRYAQNENFESDTALYLMLELDTMNITDLLNNSYFRLKVKELKLNYAKVKIPDSIWYMPWTYYYKGKKNKKLNIDFELKLYATWISDDTQIKDAEEIGSFYFLLRDAEPGKIYAPEMVGYSFFVPRSIGSYKNAEGEIISCYGQGMYNISATITESWNSDFVTTTVNSNSGKYVEDLSKMLINKIK